MASFVFAPGCGLQKADATDSAGVATDDTTGDASSSAGETTSSGVTTGGMGTTEPEPVTAGDGMPPGMSTSDTTGAPGGCPMHDPATSAAFKVSLDAWPDQSDTEHLVDSVCDVDAVDVAGAVVITTLTCDVDGVARRGEIRARGRPGGRGRLAGRPDGRVSLARRKQRVRR